MAVFDVINVGNFSSVKKCQKNIEDKKQEINQLYSFLGMELYDLQKEGKTNVPELQVHFEKIHEQEKILEELEAEKMRLEAQNKGNRTCSCGCTIMPDNKFCPRCGKEIESDSLICECGKKIKRDMQFCPYCGKKVEDEKHSDLNKNTTENFTYKECVCGAKIPEGQFMCMECGRKIEN